MNSCIKYFENIDTAEFLEKLKNNFKNYLRHTHFNEFDEVAVPWRPGFIFDEKTPIEYVELLSKLASSKNYVVFGHASNIYGDFPDYQDWQQILYIIWQVDVNHYEGSPHCKNKVLEAKFKHGFYPNYCNLVGPLPRCIIWKIFKLR